jgi:hypothetical protein
MRRVNETIVAVKKKYVLHISVCVCACVHARVRVWVWVDGHWRVLARAPPYSHLRPLSLHHIFRRSHKRHDLLKRVTKHKMCILIFSTTFFLNISHYKDNSARYCHNCENVFSDADWTKKWNQRAYRVVTTHTTRVAHSGLYKIGTRYE